MPWKITSSFAFDILRSLQALKTALAKHTGGCHEHIVERLFTLPVSLVPLLTIVPVSTQFTQSTLHEL